MAEQALPQTQTDRNEDPKDVRDEGTMAVTDEFFKRQPPLPVEPKVAKEPLTPPPLMEEEGVADPEGATTQSSVGRDYVRELQQEFEEQEEEGKV